ncbi:Glycosyltransferase involved in cell wall bisynthesis [Halogranum amylolyticum]|uniref:Glycosyltransferase involved in cell wall bisynthesis n=1 Tax=Halogranum amylolyticum TaxID=660520 RepID=A0A1H8SG63_9EURY|nr:glycosyltransferase family 4 protein [Halogranum amylolyticum]SEO77506.1 Glycosyltransferase involved in cell wall bisynthesis [Halogranum amylolyticum]
MRVGLVVYGDLDTRSGGYVYDRQLVDHLRELGDEVELFSLPERRYGRAFAQNVDRSFRRRLRAADLDVLLEDELCHPSLLWTNRRLDFDAPVVALVHHLRSAERHAPWKNGFYRRVERQYLRGVDGYVYNSETTRSTVAALAEPSPGVVAYPAGDRFGGALSPETVRERARTPTLRVVTLGNVTPRKGIHTLVEGLERTRGDWTLTVVGDDAADSAYTAFLRQRIKRLGVAGSVSFTGRLADDDVADVLARSHVLAMPSTYEGFGIAYLEGMAFGLPAVATTAGGAAELVTDRVNGLLVEPDDPSAVTDALAPLCRNRERLVRLSLAALDRYRSHPTWRETAETVQGFLRSLA